VLDRVDSVRRLLSIRREKISSRDLNGIAAGYWRKTSQIDRDLFFARSLTIQHEKDYFSLTGVMNW
jgi:hypothetical protein